MIYATQMLDRDVGYGARGVLLIWIKVGSMLTSLAVGVEECSLDIFLSSFISLFFPLSGSRSD